MKRIVNGKTYNTDTSTLIARTVYLNHYGVDVPGDRTRETLFKTKGGAFFLLKEEEREDGNGDVVFVFASPSIIPIASDEVEDWMNDGEIEVIGEPPFGWPPEATADPKLVAAE